MPPTLFVLSEDNRTKKMTYLKVVYFIGLVISLLYIVRFNFEYGVSDYNASLLTIWALLAVLPPLFLYWRKSYVLAAVTVSILEITILVYFLYLSGGVDAPGVFWLAAVPLVSAILLNNLGAALGYTAVFATLLVFGYLKLRGLAPQLILNQINYGYEKLYNVLTFLVFASYTTHYYIQGERRFHRKLAEKNTDIENLLRVLLHDIANSLSSMTYNLLKARDQNEVLEESEELHKVDRAIEDINELLAQVRHLKSVKDGKTSLPLQPLALNDLLVEFCQSSEGLVYKKKIRIDCMLPQEQLIILGERSILTSIILLNLVHNAVKFSQVGSHIDVRAYRDEKHAVLEVQDYGVGMPSHILNQLFMVNVPTSRAGTQGEKGTGYGMPLVKEYLQMMGGYIEVTSHESPTADHPQGTKVRLSFPLQDPSGSSVT